MTKWLEQYPPQSIVRKAFEFAQKAHKNTKRLNDEPYINHCLSVAQSVHEWKLDEASIAAALLHDIVEDTHFTAADIEKEFGKEIASLVEGLTKLKKLRYSQSSAQAENLRKLVIAFSKDLRVILIKLVDRRHNMQTLKALSPRRQKRIAWETAEIYAPLAYRLGMHKLSGELEDLSFPYLHPKEYKWLISTVEEQYAERDAYAKKVKPILEATLKKHGIEPLTIDYRAKRYFSLYKKLLRYEMDLGKIYDLVALRIIVKNVEECYAVLGIIHQIWPPLPGRIVDYIARPKPNGYRSLHTTVFCVDNKITEIQIRTKEMHEENELGIAAHWAYRQLKHDKDYLKKWQSVADNKELLWVRQLQEWQKHFSNSEEFLKSLKVDFFKDRIFAMTPKNEVIDLPVGATPVDFAYHIHTEIGDQCVGAKVNDKIVAVDYQLQSGDVVEIITQKGKKPSDSWLQFTKTSTARGHIRTAIRSKDKKLRKKSEQPHMEFKIINRDRPGYLKEVTSIFAKLKININHLNSQIDSRKTFSTVIAKCDILEKTKIEKLLVRIKGVSSTQEVSYKFKR